jgi:hypothetical protein
VIKELVRDQVCAPRAAPCVAATLATPRAMVTKSRTILKVQGLIEAAKIQATGT